jgi:uncharacterized protein (DUF1697 family)
MGGTRHVALLRGINLASRNRVDMAGLRELLGELGYTEVRTYLQSGNAVLTGPAAPDTVAKEIEQQLQSRYSTSIRVLVRSREELADVVKHNPFAGKETDGRKLHVNFLSAEPDPERLADIDRKDFEPDRFALRGREIYLWLPNGMQGTKLPQALSDKRLGVVTTSRNWNTVTKLLELAGG